MQQITFEKLKDLDFVSNEAYKSLRTNITFCGEDIRTVAVTSTIPNEGKSRVVFQLARAFAEDDKKILLIDADLRKSVMLSSLGVDKEVEGLSHYLAGKTSIEDSVCQTNIEKLDVMFTGALAPNPAELLGKERFDELLAWAKENYDYVLIDCPPIGSVIDAAIIAPKCDGAVYVVEAAAISYHAVAKGVEQMKKSGCKILGVVLNKVEIQSKGYGYRKYYGNYYGKYYGKYGDKS